MIVVGDLNANVGSATAKRYSGRLVDFFNFHRLVIRGTLVEHKACDKALTDQGRTSNQIGHFGISGRFRSCLSDECNKRGAKIGIERDPHLIVAYVCLGVGSAISRCVGEPRPLKFNINRFYAPAVGRKWESYLLIGQKLY